MDQGHYFWIGGFAVFILFWFWLDRRFIEMIITVGRLERRLSNLEQRFQLPLFRK